MDQVTPSVRVKWLHAGANNAPFRPRDAYRARRAERPVKPRRAFGARQPDQPFRPSQAFGARQAGRSCGAGDAEQTEGPARPG
jgi:hypothetical protein